MTCQRGTTTTSTSCRSKERAFTESFRQSCLVPQLVEMPSTVEGCNRIASSFTRLRQWYLAKFPSQARKTRILCCNLLRDHGWASISPAKHAGWCTQWPRRPSNCPALGQFSALGHGQEAQGSGLHLPHRVPQVDIYHSISANMLPTPAK